MFGLQFMSELVPGKQPKHQPLYRQANGLRCGSGGNGAGSSREVVFEGFRGEGNPAVRSAAMREL